MAPPTPGHPAAGRAAVGGAAVGGAAVGRAAVGRTRTGRPAARPHGSGQPAAAQTAFARTALAALSIGALLVGLAAAALGLDAVRAVALLVFCLLGVGSAPWQLDSTIQLPARLGLTVLTSLVVLVATPLLMMATQAWYPRIAFAVVVAICVPLHLAGAWWAMRRARPRAGWVAQTGPGTVARSRAGRLARARAGGVAQRRAGGVAQAPPRWRAQARAGWLAQARSPAVLASAVGLAICLAAALTHRHLDPGIGGFVPRIGVAWYVGLAFLLLALAVARDDDERQLALPVLAMLLVLTLTPALVYDGPRSQSAAKHADLVQQIRTLHRTDSIVQVYNDWPGFFAAMAWLCDILGVRDPVRLAAYWPAIVGVLRLTALRYLFGQALPIGYRCWTAVAAALLVDVLNTDYFSPQSMGLVIGLVTFGIALSTRATRARPVLILVAGCVLALSHQLSPFIVGGVLVVLAVFRQVRPWWTPALVLGPALVWTLTHSSGVARFVSLEKIGRLQNFRPPKTVAGPGLDRLAIVDATVGATLAGIALLGGLALLALVRRRRELRAWAFACCPAVGVGLVLINPYGQEGAFRAAVFGIPWLAMLAAMSLPPLRRVNGRMLLSGGIAVCTATFLVASFGLDASNVTRPSDLAAFAYTRDRAADRPDDMCYVLQLGTGDLPAPVPIRSTKFRTLTGADLGDPGAPGSMTSVGSTGSGADGLTLAADRQVAAITARLVQYTGEPVGAAQLYAVWSPAASAYQHEYGVQRPEQFAALREAFRGSPYWEVGFARDGTVVFRFLAANYRGGPA